MTSGVRAGIFTVVPINRFACLPAPASRWVVQPQGTPPLADYG